MSSPEDPKPSKGNQNRCAWITIGATFLFLICIMVTVLYITEYQDQQGPDDNIASVPSQVFIIDYVATEPTKGRRTLSVATIRIPLQGAVLPYLSHTLTKAKKICKSDTCGIGAICQQGFGGTRKCACPPEHVGNPVEKCVKLECVANDHCQRNESCYNQQCVDPCQNVCGKNAICNVWNHTPVCSCPKGYKGNPAFEDCKEAEPENELQTGPYWPAESVDADMLDEEDGIKLDEALAEAFPQFNQGKDAPDMTEASVHTEGPSEYEQLGIQDPCKSSPCGPNATCSITLNGTLCYYDTYYDQDGSSMLNFRNLNLTEQHECEADDDCDSHLACRGYKCVSPCSDCAEYTICKKSDHRAICTCRRGFSGDPRIECSPECEEDADCPSKTPLCVNYACVDPCHGACGINAQCQYKEESTICACGRYTTGDPLVFCRPTDHSVGNFCDPNPCGANATCTLSGYTSDNSTVEEKEYPLCSCPSGYVGHPRISCELPECNKDSDCTEDMACFDYQCVDPCDYDGNACGVGADCATTEHLVFCTCQEGKYGDPFSGCYGGGGGGGGGGAGGKVPPGLIAILLG